MGDNYRTGCQSHSIQSSDLADLNGVDGFKK